MAFSILCSLPTVLSEDAVRVIIAVIYDTITLSTNKKQFDRAMAIMVQNRWIMFY